MMAENGLSVLVTGAGSGIGRAIAEAFVAEGCNVHICDINPAAVADFLEANPGATATVGDVSKLEDVDRAVSDLARRTGTLDVLVNNTGVAGPIAAVEDIEPEEWDHTIAVDLSSHFYFVRKAVPLIKKAGGGSIINIASSAAFHGCPLRSPYSAVKWAMLGLTKTWAMELGPFAIRVNAICPGSVDGERIRGVIERDAKTQGKSVDEMRQSYLMQSSMRTFINPEDIANLALFLSSDAGAKISGQALGLDGHTESFSVDFK
jgi:NAD(P)-dependent dehydrogenase (short-subunit alcohol dehydrogenase family)